MPGVPQDVRRRRADDGARLLRDGDLPDVPPGLPAARAERFAVHVPALQGAVHDRGEGVTRNLATAAIWYEVAVEHGDEIAAERLEELRAETRDIFKGMRFV